MNELMVLEFESQKIRVVGTKDNPMWVAADVCRILAINNPSATVAKFRVSEKGITTVYTPQGGRQEMLTVTEPGLYRLILKSRKPEAERLRVFLTHEVMPSLRKHGCYPPPDVSVDGAGIVRFDADAFGKALGAELNKKFAPRFDSIEDRLDGVEDAVRSLEQRKGCTAKVRRLHVQVVYRMYDGRCPCCQVTRIVSGDGERLDSLQFDHWRLRSQNGADYTWAICRDCNLKLRDGDFKDECEIHFKSYQARRRQLERMVAPRQMRLKFKDRPDKSA